MDRKSLFELYGKYYDPIQSLASLGIFEIPTVDKVFSNKSQLQSVYRDMKDMKFRGTAIEYIAWLSTVHLIDSLRGEVEGADILDWALAAIDNYHKHKADTKNFWRNWAYYPHFPSTLTAEIQGLDYPFDTDSEAEWGGSDIDLIKKWMRFDAGLSAFGALIVYEETVGKTRENYDELVDFIKKLATAKVE